MYDAASADDPRREDLGNEQELERRPLGHELRSAPATPPPPPPPPVKQTPKKKRFSLRNFFGCRGGSPG